MCGIAGIRRFGDTPISREELQILICSLEHRGNHASGIAIMNGADIAIHKMPEPAWSFMKHNSTDGFLNEHLKEDTDIVLLHTRFATKGDPGENRNNHPFFAGTTAVVHNGHISNDDSLFRSMNLQREAETDSDIFRAVFDSEGFTEKAARDLSRASGSGAIAAFSTAAPGVLALGRSGNPVIVADYNEKLYFASELRSIHKAVRPFMQRYGLWMRRAKEPMAYNTLQDHTLYFIHPDQTATHHSMNISFGDSFRSPVYKSHENYSERMKTWKIKTKPNKVFTACRKCQRVQSKFEATSWANLKCNDDKCAESFAYLETAVAHA